MVLALGPVGCGFQPVYARKSGADSSPVAARLASVRVLAIEDRVGQILRNNLVERLSPRGEPGGADYELEIKMSEYLGGLAVSQDGNAQVGRTMIIVTYKLVDTKTAQTTLVGQGRAYGGYRFLGPRYASVVSEREGESSAAQEVAEQIVADLVAFFANRELGDGQRKALINPATEELRRAREAMPPPGMGFESGMQRMSP